MDKNIGFIGLGNVGSKIANNILKGGYRLFVYDLNKNLANNLINKGAIWCDSNKDLISKSSVFITCLPSPESVKKVITDSLNIINNNHLWIEMSTTDEYEMQYLADLVLNKNAEVLEAPITGGQHRAESGNISVLVGGERRSFERSFPILKLIGYKILHCGNIGNASMLKVTTNYLASVNLIALGEALMVCKKYGLDLKTAYEGIKISSGNSFVHETEGQVILNGSYDVGFTMDLACKDVGLFNKLTKKYKIPAGISNLIQLIFAEGRKKLGDRSFSTSIVKLLEDKCDVSLRAKGFPKILTDKENKKKGEEVNIQNEY